MRNGAFKGVFIRIGLLAVVVGSAGLTGCSNSLQEENALLIDENTGLRAQLGERNEALSQANTDLRDKDMQMSSLRREADDLRNQPQQVVMQPAQSDPFGGIPGVTGSVGAGEITATVESDVLFDSGKTSLKKAAKRSLDAVASVLTSNYSGRRIRVEGFTDSDPIKKSGFKSNHHLGFERAYAVRSYLVDRGVPSNMVYASSHGPDVPKGTKASSRRVEIAVIMNE